MIEYIGLWLLAAMTLNMWGLTCVLQSGESLIRRLIWALVLLMPVLGFLAWFLLGPRARSVG
ncbi:MAG: PLDc N-terminal domain-containing protein [Paracoccaceae bacterium]